MADLEALDLNTEFVIDNERGEIALQTRGAPLTVAFTGTFAGAGGQCADAIRAALGDIEHTCRPELVEILDAWDALHMREVAGLTDAERVVLDDLELEFRVVNGERFGAPGDIEDIDDADFSNASDIIDSRDVIKRIEELTGAFEAAGLDWERLLPKAPDYDAQGLQEDAEAFERALELKALTDLEEEASGYAPDWTYGATLIRETYFTEYAEEMAEDIGATDGDAKWPLNHIDWAAAARELRQDYTEVDFDGVAYLIR